MKIKRKPTFDIEVLKKLFDDLTEPLDPPKLTRFQGRLTAKYVVLSPAPEQEDYDRRLPWAGPLASTFFSSLLTYAPDLDHNTDFLVLPTSFSGLPTKKGSDKASVSIVLEWLTEFAKQRGSSVTYLAVGPSVFKTLFREGAASEPEMLCGYWLYPEILNGAKMLVFPEPKPLMSSDDKDDYDNYRAFAVSLAARKACQRHYDRVLKVFEAGEKGKLIAKERD